MRDHIPLQLVQRQRVVYKKNKKTTPGRQRHAGEGLVGTRLMELELKLLQVENKLVSDRLGT